MITSFYRVGGGPVQRDLSREEITRLRAAGEGLLWVDLEAPSPEEATAILADTFQFHHLTVEDCLNGRVDTPKIDDHGDYVFVVVQGINFNVQDEAVETAELNLFLGKNYVVSYHDLSLPSVAAMRDRCEQDERLLGRGADYLTHALLDTLVDDLLPIVVEMDEVIVELEERVLANPNQECLQALLVLRRNTLNLRRALNPQRDVVNRFARGDYPELVRRELNIYFRDIYDHLVRVEDMVEALRDLTDVALNTYLSVINNRMNEVMKVLSIAAVIFLPLSLIASIYGTNFQNVPELGWRWGYFGMLAAMAVIALGLVAFFRWRKWF